MSSRIWLTGLAVFFSLTVSGADCAEPFMPHWVWTKAHAVPKHTTSEGSGYFSIIEGRDREDLHRHGQVSAQCLSRRI